MVFAVLLAAALLLYLLPAESGRPAGSLLEPARFAWPVKPELTAMFMGACYGAGAYFFRHVSWGRGWHTVACYFPGISLFATMMGVATFLHWERFNHEHVAFFLWLVLYVTTPLLVPVLYLRNRGADPGAALPGPRVPRAVRRAVGAGGAILLALAALLYLAPATAAELWPWELTPLTSRVVAAFIVAFATTAVVLAREPRWSAWRVNVRAAALSAALLLGAAARAGDELAGDAASYAFLAAVGALLAAAIALDRAMERGAGARAAPP